MCVLDFDHHCPAVGNCVGLHNRKAFLGVAIHGFCATALLVLRLGMAGHLTTAMGTGLVHILGRNLAPSFAQHWADACVRSTPISGLEAVLQGATAVYACWLCLLLGLLAGLHTALLLQKRGTLDYLSARDKKRHDHGHGRAGDVSDVSDRNGALVQQHPQDPRKASPAPGARLILGKRWWLWPFPVLSRRDKIALIAHACLPFELLDRGAGPRGANMV